MTPDLCIYHANCDDGFGAAYAVWLRDGDSVTYQPAAYGDLPPDVTGLDVAIVDFSYKRPILKEMAAKAKSILVLDHHKTAQADLADLSNVHPNVIVEFDMERSGAVMAWQHFHPGQAIPKFFLYLQDRDLWTKQLPNVDEFTMALRSYPQKFGIWAGLLVDNLVDEGKAIHRYFRTLVEQAKKNKYSWNIAGHVVPVVNAPAFLASEVAGELAEGQPFAGVYSQNDEFQFWSLRSREGGLDVSEIAKLYGGGGHARAAGFRVAVSGSPWNLPLSEITRL